MSLFCPPPGFPVHLLPFWPLVWAQVLMIRAWVRATYGKGTLYRWGVTAWGQAIITEITWVPGDGDPQPFQARLVANARRLEAATSGEWMRRAGYTPPFGSDILPQWRGEPRPTCHVTQDSPFALIRAP